MEFGITSTTTGSQSRDSGCDGEITPLVTRPELIGAAATSEDIIDLF